MPTEAKIIADSISPEGVRLTTMQVTFHRFVLAEFNTHRVFSRNSASSRAIPVVKQVERIVDDLAWPLAWPAEKSGMQGGKEVRGGTRLRAVDAWHTAAEAAIEAVRRLTSGEPPIHKSVTNRLLEPFMWHTVVVTSTAWENFFDLRLDTDAQPEIRVAAEFMKAAYDGSEPQPLREGEWHLPYVSGGDWLIVRSNIARGFLSEDEVTREAYHLATRISSARCARTSYLTQDGKRDLNEDLRLYDRLITDRLAAGKALHWSPLEHVATPWPENRQAVGVDEGMMGRPYCPYLSFDGIDGNDHEVPTDHLPRVGNLLGWRSLRTEVEATTGTVTFR